MEQQIKLSVKDFEFIKTIGKGAYGEVLLAKKKGSDELCAVKALSKQQLKKEKKTYQVLIEKEILTHLDHVGIIKFYHSFQDNDYVYIALEYMNSGDFAEYLHDNSGKLNIDTIKFYTAEIILILEYLHNNGIAHRDLKPENLLITEDRHLKCIDFGTALLFNENLIEKQFVDRINEIKQKFQTQLKIADEEDFIQQQNRVRQGTFVGSPQYVSPELLQTNLSGPEADLWALGCIIYKMFTNDTPFMSGNEYLIFQLVKKGDYKIPSNIPPEAVDLIQKLLNLDPKQRLGAGKQGSVNDYRALKSHPFFKGINWEKLFSQQAPHRPVQYGANNISKLGDSDDDENQTQNSGWGNPNKKPILQGIVSKKVGFFIYKKRNMLLLPNPPTLLYYETDGDQKKLGEIKLQKEIKAQLHDNNSFTIGGVSKKGKTKTLYFKGAENATLWVTKINDLVQTVQ